MDGNEHRFTREELPSGKVITRHFAPDGALLEEHHVFGILDIGISFGFRNGVKVDESYFSKQRMISRNGYEKARVGYPDMPAPEANLEDSGGSLLRKMRQQQRRNKAEAERRLAESAESRYPRPASTNWLRVISGDKAYLVIFASRDWKVLARERSLPSGRDWLNAFGFGGPRDRKPSLGEGLEVGFEVDGDRNEMLNVSRTLLDETTKFVANLPEPSRWSGSIRPWAKPRKPPPLIWPTVLPPLIEFLAGLSEPTVKIFNHHR
jgi:hypothetical protein